MSPACNNQLTSRTGVIESPNFPNPYPYSRTCTWVVAAPLGSTINASFSHFGLERNTGCQYDYLEVMNPVHGCSLLRAALSLNVHTVKLVSFCFCVYFMWPQGWPPQNTLFKFCNLISTKIVLLTQNSTYKREFHILPKCVWHYHDVLALITC